MLPTVQTILFPTDLSPQAPEGFRYAMSLAQKYGAKIVVVHAVEPLSPFAKSLVDTYIPKETGEELRREARENILGEIRNRLELLCQDELCVDPDGRDRVSEIRVLEGHPFDVILEEIERTKADMVVMGSHGHTAVGEILMGTIAHRVIQHSPVPVLLVRLKKRP